MSLIPDLNITIDEYSYDLPEERIAKYPLRKRDESKLLIYDNGNNRSFTRIVELNPLTKIIEWEYKSDPPEIFYSKLMPVPVILPQAFKFY